MGDLETIFNQFCDSVKKGSKTGTDKMIKKLCTDCKIYAPHFDANIVDIQFRKYVGNRKKDVNYNEFIEFIDGPLSQEYAKVKKISQNEAANQIKSKVLGTAPKLHGTTSASKDDATARLTDVKGYTGAHKERFDAETGEGKGIEGRVDVLDDRAAEGYVAGYKGKDTYDEAK